MTFAVLASQSGSADENAAKETGRVDRMHDFVSAGVRGLADRLDRFFTDRRSLAEEQRSRLLLKPTVAWVENQAPEVSVPLDGRLVLPRLEEKLRLQITTTETDSTDDRELVDDQETGSDERSTLLGLVFTTVAEQTRNVSLRAGLRVRDGTIKPAASARARFTMPAGDWISRFTQSLFHDGDEFGARTLLDFDRRMAPGALFRSASSLTVTETSDGAELRQEFSLRRLRNARTGVEAFFAVEGHTDPVTVADRYVIGTELRERAERQWLTLSVRPELRYPRELAFAREAALIVALEMEF